ncbi:hypothetical protein AOLI_G00084890 [Acnodon oligacanthus]
MPALSLLGPAVLKLAEASPHTDSAGKTQEARAKKDIHSQALQDPLLISKTPTTQPPLDASPESFTLAWRDSDVPVLPVADYQKVKDCLQRTKQGILGGGREERQRRIYPEVFADWRMPDGVVCESERQSENGEQSSRPAVMTSLPPQVFNITTLLLR